MELPVVVGDNLLANDGLDVDRARSEVREHLRVDEVLAGISVMPVIRSNSGEVELRSVYEVGVFDI